MSDATFGTPSIHLNRIYTKAGDGGQTRLVGGQRIDKDDLRIECYGTVDELNSQIGLARVLTDEAARNHPRLAWLAVILKRVQHELFNLGSVLATLPDDLHPQQPRILPADVEQLEKEIDASNAELPALRSFVLPGGSRLDAELHICRTVCRRAERLLVTLMREQGIADLEPLKYLNRLSDALFVWSRWVDYITGSQETLWEPNAAAGAQSRI